MGAFKHIRISISLLLTLVFLLLATGWLPLPFLQRLENLTYDVRLRTALEGGIDHRIVIVDLDERSLLEEGHWPWRRDKLAQLVDTLFDHYFISMLGFDMVFAERDDRSGLEHFESLAQGPLSDNQDYLQQLERLRPQLQHDQLFADSLRDRDVILGYTASGKNKIGQLPPALMALDEQQQRIPFIAETGHTANLPELQSQAYGAGSFGYSLQGNDEDGIFRRTPMVFRYQNNLYESLALAMVRGLYGNPPLKLGVAGTSPNQGPELGLEWLEIGDSLRIPVDAQGRSLIPYRGRGGNFPYVSATDVLNKKVDPKVLENAIVLLGTTAPGLKDLRATPVHQSYPGVEIHANMIGAMLDQASEETKRFKHHPAYTRAGDLLTLLILGLFLSYLLPRLSPLMGMAAGTLTLAAILGFNLLFWHRGLVLPLASQLLLFVTLLFYHNLYGFFAEAGKKHRLRQQFGHYVPSEVVEEMNRAGGDFGLGGESREMTVLFSDIYDFTPISERMEPDELARMMNAYFNHMTDVIQQRKGTIDKYIGDAIMAFWGAPLFDPEHPQHAVEAALKMSQRMEAVRQEFKTQGWPELRIGIGIATGLMNVGNMGSRFRMTYTVLGDTVNLGARLEGQTRKYGADIIVSEITRTATTGIAYRELDRVKVKGKNQLVTIYEPMGFEDKLSEEAKTSLVRYQAALGAYRSDAWDRAERLFSELALAEPHHKLYRHYLERIEKKQSWHSTLRQAD